MNRKWHVLTIELSSESSDLAVAALFSLGSEGSEEIPGKNSSTVVVSSYFSASKFSRDEIVKTVKEVLDSWGVILTQGPTATTSELKDWSETWKQWFDPFEIVENIIVAPTWKADGIDRDKSIIMDPKMAFGTGLHPTTKLCAGRIFALNSSGRSGSLLDIGSGSGILAILARRLSFSPVAAVENDPEALLCARENFAINKTPEISSFPELKEVRGHYETVVANILLNTLCELKESILSVLAPEGLLVLSGITRDQEEELTRAYADSAKTLETVHMAEWSALVMKKGK